MNERHTVHLILMDSTSSTPYTIWMSVDLFTAFRIDPNRKLWFRYGSERIQVFCKPSKIDQDLTIYIPKELALVHHLPSYEGQYSLSFRFGKEELRIGPIFGLLSEKVGGTTELFGKITNFARELDLLCKESHCVFYLFSPSDIEVDKIHGYKIEGNQLKPGIYPYPDVIYNRISNRALERSDECLQFFERCKDLGVLYFNDHFLSKWEAHCILLESDALAPHLPKTGLLDGIESIGKLIDNHRTVFLKPIHGSNGKGIIRVMKKDHEQYQLDVSRTNSETSIILSKKAISQLINHHFPSTGYLVQQGIQLMTHQDCKVDFRVLCNRNHDGKWCISSSTARVSIQKQFVSNVSKGAMMYPLPYILKQYFNEEKAQQIKKLIYELSIEVVEHIQLNTNGIYGELGVDIGVDFNGIPWVLEVNTKPSKQYPVFKENIGIRPSARGIYQFSRYLTYTQFQQNGVERRT